MFVNPAALRAVCFGLAEEYIGLYALRKGFGQDKIDISIRFKRVILAIEFGEYGEQVGSEVVSEQVESRVGDGGGIGLSVGGKITVVNGIVVLRARREVVGIAEDVSIDGLENLHIFLLCPSVLCEESDAVSYGELLDTRENDACVGVVIGMEDNEVGERVGGCIVGGVVHQGFERNGVYGYVAFIEFSEETFHFLCGSAVGLDVDEV